MSRLILPQQTNNVCTEHVVFFLDGLNAGVEDICDPGVILNPTSFVQKNSRGRDVSKNVQIIFPRTICALWRANIAFGVAYFWS